MILEKAATVTVVGDSATCTEKVLHEPTSDDIPLVFHSQFAAFADLVAHGTAFPVSTALSRAVIETVLGIYQATESERPLLLGAGAQPVRAQR